MGLPIILQNFGVFSKNFKRKLEFEYFIKYDQTVYPNSSTTISEPQAQSKVMFCLYNAM